MHITPVSTPADLKRFLNYPYQHYRNDPVWVPPLRGEQKAQFDPKNNPMLEHCTYQLFLALEGEQVVGRISAFTDHLAQEHWKQPIGLFGSYECIEDDTVSHALLDAAQNWLGERGMRFMRGPWSFASQEWGLVLEGFEPSPVIMAPYNPPYYNDQLTAFGLSKVKDLLAYVADCQEGYDIPERYLTLTQKVQARYGVRVRPINMQRLEEEVVMIVNLANESIADNWGFYPVTDAEGRAMARDMREIVNPEALLIAEDRQGRPIGFAMSLPDVNLLLRGLNGRLFPFGWVKLLAGLPRIDQYRMWALGVIPEYQGCAIDSLLYMATRDALVKKNVRLEINYVLEDNDRMNNAIVKLGAKPYRRYRVYEMPIDQRPQQA